MSKSSKPKRIVKTYRDLQDYALVTLYDDGTSEKIYIDLHHPNNLTKVYANVGNDVNTETEEDNTDIQEQITEIVLTLTKEFEEKVAHERALRAEAEKCAEDLRYEISGLRRELQGRDEQDRGHTGTPSSGNISAAGIVARWASKDGWKEPPF